VCRVDEPFNMQMSGLEAGFNIELLSVLRMTVDGNICSRALLTRETLAPWQQFEELSTRRYAVFSYISTNVVD
jgi:hypothetical protein